MQKAAVIIPNLNGETYIRACLDSLRNQDTGDFTVIVVDNGSTDGSSGIIREEYPEVQLIELDRNYGFCKAVNEGIRATDTEYVILLNNDTEAAPGFVRKLVEAMEGKEQIFSCQARMRQMDHPDKMDDAGNYYCALGWAFTVGRGEPSEKYSRPAKIFSSCGGACIYRRKVLDQIGLFDERHFAYLEDVDLGYRAKITGYENWYAPEAEVLHKGSATSGSRHNAFKVYHASRNNLYLIYKNMARWQILINLPFFAAGCMIKCLYFSLKGLGGSYLKGLWHGILLAREGEKVSFLAENFDHCCRIQLELWKNMGILLRKNK